ncbi:MAG: DUF4400 domain-containing protein [Thiobacillus sp.]|nr:DUF4400 domain-containing protein [Thiobacillus sp.]
MASKRVGLYDNNVAVAFLWPLKWLFGTVLLYVLLALIALVVAFLFAKYQWVDPVTASDALFQAESARVARLLQSGAHAEGFASLPLVAQRWTYWLFFQATTLHDATYAYIAGQRVNEVDQMYLTQFVARNVREIYLAMNVIQVYGIRIGFLMASVPLFMLLYFVATADGLTERYIRRACAGRESADIHKLGRLSKLMFFASAVTVYLCTPVAISPFWVIVPLAAIFAFATRLQWQFYKKYF